MSDEREWYFQRDGREWGPLSLAELDEMVAGKDLPADVQVRNREDASWRNFDLLAPAAERFVPPGLEPGGVLSYHASPTTSPQLAEFHVRILAALVDFVIAGLVFSFIAHGVDAFAGGDAAGIVALTLWWLYFALGESRGGTVGKRLLGIRVVRLDFEPIRFRHALARNLCKPFSGLFLCAGVFMALFSERRQMFHDWVVNTIVVRK